MFSGWRLFPWTTCFYIISCFSMFYKVSLVWWADFYVFVSLHYFKTERREGRFWSVISSSLCCAATLWTVGAAAARPALISCLYYKLVMSKDSVGCILKTCCAILKWDDNKFLECWRLALFYSEARLCHRWQLKCPRARQRGSSQSRQRKTDGVLSSSRSETPVNSSHTQ